MKAPNKRYFGQHIKDCGALREVARGWWKTPWGVPERKWLNAWGLEGGRDIHIWIEWGCNVMECQAKLRVKNDYLLKAIGESK